MSDLPLVQMPDAEEMNRRLLAVDDNPHLVERFYPLVLKMAGKKLTGPGVVIDLTLAIYDYTEALGPVVATPMRLLIPTYVRALVPESSAARKDTMAAVEAMDL